VLGALPNKEVPGEERSAGVNSIRIGGFLAILVVAGIFPFGLPSMATAHFLPKSELGVRQALQVCARSTGQHMGIRVIGYYRTPPATNGRVMLAGAIFGSNLVPLDAGLKYARYHGLRFRVPDTSAIGFNLPYGIFPRSHLLIDGTLICRGPNSYVEPRRIDVLTARVPPAVSIHLPFIYQHRGPGASPWFRLPNGIYSVTEENRPLGCANWVALDGTNYYPAVGLQPNSVPGAPNFHRGGKNWTGLTGHLVTGVYRLQSLDVTPNCHWRLRVTRDS
jgi:hypothetical protein